MISLSSDISRALAAERATRLEEGAVELWAAAPEDLCDSHTLTRFAGWLDAEEERRRARFAFARDRLTYLVCHGLLRGVLARHTGIPPHRLRFEHNRWGRPELANPVPWPRVRFNLSRTRGLVVLAVARGCDVGVDVEHIGSAEAVLEVARMTFHPAEMAELDALGEAERGEAAVRLWTLKEAYLKARGLGLSGGLDSVRFRLGEERKDGRDGSVRIRVVGEGDESGLGWRFKSFRASEEHWIAVAVGRGGR